MATETCELVWYRFFCRKWLFSYLFSPFFLTRIKPSLAPPRTLPPSRQMDCEFYIDHLLSMLVLKRRLFAPSQSRLLSPNSNRRDRRFLPHLCSTEGAAWMIKFDSIFVLLPFYQRRSENNLNRKPPPPPKKKCIKSYTYWIKITQLLQPI